MNRPLGAFSLIEMLFVLLLLSLGFVLPKIADTSLEKAKIQIMNDLRFTRNLATKDERQTLRNFNQAWDSQAQAEVGAADMQAWRLQFHTISNKVEGYVGTTYSIFAKRPRKNGSIDNKPMGFVSIARNPFNGTCLSWYNYGDLPLECRNIRDERLKIEQKYGITNVRFVWNTKGCTATHKTLHFDSLGRIYCGTSKLVLVSSDARIVLESKKGEIEIRLQEL